MARKRRRRTAAQRAATAKMIAARRAATKPRIKRRTARRKRSWPITPAPVASRAGRQLRYRRPNPIGYVGNFVANTLAPAAIGGAGALGLDMLMGVLPLPTALTTGMMRPVTRIAGAAALGAIAGAITDRRTAEQIAAGAMVVVLYDTMRGFIRGAGVRLPGLSDADVIDGIGAYVDDGLASTDESTIGYREAAIQVGAAHEEGVGVYVDDAGMPVYR